KRFRLEGCDPNDLDLTTMNLLQTSDDEFLKSYFNYIRIRIRVSCSTAPIQLYLRDEKLV
ncbi:MAG: hypothetical protein AAFZ49_01550, partial [Cyanobacteria bacterium J06659_2]